MNKINQTFLWGVAIGVSRRHSSAGNGFSVVNHKGQEIRKTCVVSKMFLLEVLVPQLRDAAEWNLSDLALLAKNTTY